MTEAARIRALEHKLDELEARLRPQVLRDALEFTFDPRGEEPRVIDSAGRTLNYQGALQFVGATAVEDGANKRIVVTSAAASGGLSAVFSDDAATTDAERLKFVGQAAPGTNRLTLDTLTVGTNRQALLLLAEDVSAPTTLAALLLSADAVADSAGAIWSLFDAAGSFVQDSKTVASGAVDTTVTAIGAAGAATGGLSLSGSTATLTESASATGAAAATLSAASSAGTATTSVVADGAQLVLVDDGTDQSALVAGGMLMENTSAGTNRIEARTLAGTGARTILDINAASNYLQNEVAANNAAAVRRVIRGPFSAASGALGAGGTVTVAVAQCVPAAAAAGSVAVIGSLVGAAGVEAANWSWQFGGAVQGITVSFTDVGGAGTSGAFALQFYTICDL